MLAMGKQFGGLSALRMFAKDIRDGDLNGIINSILLIASDQKINSSRKHIPQSQELVYVCHICCHVNKGWFRMHMQMLNNALANIKVAMLTSY